jgi:adenosine/AMP kinase
MDFSLVPVAIPQGANVIIGQSHFIKTVEDLYEVMVTTVPGAKFGLAFNESSGARLVRTEGNDDGLVRAATETALAVGAGHTFVIFVRDAYPINVLDRIKGCAEVCRVYCATANPLEVIVCETPQGRGIMGVIDGQSPIGVEGGPDRQWRHEFLRKIGYKR